MTMEAKVKLREEEFLEHCFMLLSKLSHDKLKEAVMLEKEDPRNQSSLLWGCFLHQIITFADLEKTFYTLAFVENSSNFGRNWLIKREQNFTVKYGCLLSELKRIETVHQDLVPAPLAHSQEFPCFQNIRELVNSVGGQLQHFVIARMNIISFYEQLPCLATNKNVSVEDLFKIIKSTLEEFLSKNFQSLVLCFKETYRMECEVVVNLLKMQLHLQKCQYLESVISFACASKYLTSWYNILFSKEAKKLTFGNSSHKAWAPELYEWLSRFKGLLLSKFNFYFFDVLCQNGGNPNEVRNNTAKAPIDFYARTTSIYKKTDALKILLVMTNLNNLDESSRRQGYFLPTNIGSQRESLLNFTSEAANVQSNAQNSVSSSLLLSPSPEHILPSKSVIFEYPPEKSQSSYNHLLSLFDLLDSKKNELDQPGKIVCANDEMFQHSFVIMKIEGSIHLVTVLNKKYPKVDSNLTNFYNSLSSDLRCNKLFMAWKQGSK